MTNLIERLKELRNSVRDEYKTKTDPLVALPEEPIFKAYSMTQSKYRLMFHLYRNCDNIIEALEIAIEELNEILKHSEIPDHLKSESSVGIAIRRIAELLKVEVEDK